MVLQHYHDNTIRKHPLWHMHTCPHARQHARTPSTIVGEDSVDLVHSPSVFHHVHDLLVEPLLGVGNRFVPGSNKVRESSRTGVKVSLQLLHLPKHNVNQNRMHTENWGHENHNPDIRKATLLLTTSTPKRTLPPH